METFRREEAIWRRPPTAKRSHDEAFRRPSAATSHNAPRPTSFRRPPTLRTVRSQTAMSRLPPTPVATLWPNFAMNDLPSSWVRSHIDALATDSEEDEYVPAR